MTTPSRVRTLLPWRVVIMLSAGLSLLIGLNAGLTRLGVWAPVDSVRVADLHGPVMVLGFLGTVIALERAQALRQAWAYLAPTLLGFGSLWLIVGLPPVTGAALMAQGALLFVAVVLALWWRSRAALVVVQVMAAALAAIAASLLLVRSVSDLISVLSAFVVITIAAERAELAQLHMGPRALTHLIGWSSSMALGAVLVLAWPETGGRIFGVTLVGVAAWLLADDVGRRTIRSTGLPRYNGAALLLGNAWLLVAGVGWCLWGSPTTTEQLDIVVHTVFLGFAMSMVMAHAPIILPAVIGKHFPYRWVLWIPLIALHLSLVVRVAGAVVEHERLWHAGGVGTVVSLVVFLLTSVSVVIRG